MLIKHIKAHPQEEECVERRVIKFNIHLCSDKTLDWACLLELWAPLTAAPVVFAHDLDNSWQKFVLFVSVGVDVNL